MTKTTTVPSDCALVIRGYSDDTFICEGPGVDLDGDDCAANSVRELVIEQPDGSGLVVRAQFGLGAGWFIGAAPLDEDKPFRGVLTLLQDKHTMVLGVPVASGTRLSLSRPKK